MMALLPFFLASSLIFFQLYSASTGERCIDLSFTAGRSDALLRDWKPLTFPKISRHTKYTLIEDEKGKKVIKAHSDASASALIREFELDPKEHPVLRWRWKVENVIKKGNARRKEGDDYAARIYVNFVYEPEKASIGSGRNTARLAPGTESIPLKRP